MAICHVRKSNESSIDNYFLLSWSGILKQHTTTAEVLRCSTRLTHLTRYSATVNLVRYKRLLVLRRIKDPGLRKDISVAVAQIGSHHTTVHGCMMHYALRVQAESLNASFDLQVPSSPHVIVIFSFLARHHRQMSRHALGRRHIMARRG